MLVTCNPRLFMGLLHSMGVYLATLNFHKVSEISLSLSIEKLSKRISVKMDTG